jgi:hypothetical protein
VVSRICGDGGDYGWLSSPLRHSARYFSLQNLPPFLCQAGCLSESGKQHLGAGDTKARQIHSRDLHLLCAEEPVGFLNVLFGLLQGLLDVHGREIAETILSTRTSTLSGSV